MTAINIFLIFVGVFAVVLLYGVVIYNSLIALRNRFKNAFSQIDVQLQRRYDLIPNLVETTKAYMKHERETLDAVITARNQASSAEAIVAKDPGHPDAMKKLISAETVLSSSMGRLFALAENYPDLKANQTMQQLMEELSSTENKVGFARQAFNDAVMLYNTAREQFPQNIIAGMFQFQAATHYEIEEPEAKKPIKVSFN
ncbi:LemA family protein [Candidatus Berkiella cookevillensis]|uniref:LemA family protein n=1 Tax=Candidatus Berkiella cookevillensis TaxID=437022 RepID=A0A0Q9YR50_9GAMM|nr:LemA family protein [Candidatus Berkiella cookevillensis]MCS5708521.1 LemA family protein [Candidatus Berkiella cookevillensis]